MIYGHARGSTDGQSLEAQAAQRAAARAGKLFQEVASAAKAGRALRQLGLGNVRKAR